VLKKRIKELLEASQERGWLLEPEGKELMRRAGLPVPSFAFARSEKESLSLARKIGYPVVAKVVSPLVLHKSDRGGVLTGIAGDEDVRAAWRRLSAIEGFEGMLVEETVQGVEMIVGAKIDFQFGPVILLGMGGTAVEVCPDAVIRMAPLEERDPELMIDSLKGRRLLEGYRGRAPINLASLSNLLFRFSQVVMDLQAFIESIDLNPVICSLQASVIADVRVMLKARKAA
jgi:succinyl-CoA synthetase beta subunit